MSERGFIAVDRGVFDHPIFTDEPKTEREAWLWIVANASWAPQQKRVGSQVLDLQRGQLGCSLRFLAKAWMWNESRVRRFLAKLQAAQMIDAVATQMATQITVCNYDVYQQTRRSSDTASDAVATQTITKKQETSSEPNGSSTPSARATLIGDFQPDEAVGVELGLSPEQSHREALKFRDWALSAPKAKATKRDWPATWRNWARRAFDDLPKSKHPGGTHGQSRSYPVRPSSSDNVRQGVRGALAGRRLREPSLPLDQGGWPDRPDDEHPGRVAPRTVSLERGEDGTYADLGEHQRRYAGARH